jgi:methionine sulfoxide reductase heme-binding subunit
MKNTAQKLKPIIFIAALLPLAWLVYAVFTDNLGANPIEAITRSLGDWALRFLLLTLLATPLRSAMGWSWPIAYRRMLGLYAFFYATLHLTSYIVLDQFFYWPDIWADIIKRPFITVGMVSFVLLIPLALTSNRYSFRRLGRNWQRLHRLVYVITAGVILHFFMMQKVTTMETMFYLFTFVLLMLARLPARWFYSIRDRSYTY